MCSRQILFWWVWTAATPSELRGESFVARQVLGARRVERPIEIVADQVGVIAGPGLKRRLTTRRRGERHDAVVLPAALRDQKEKRRLEERGCVGAGLPSGAGHVQIAHVRDVGALMVERRGGHLAQIVRGVRVLAEAFDDWRVRRNGAEEWLEWVRRIQQRCDRRTEMRRPEADDRFDARPQLFEIE